MTVRKLKDFMWKGRVIVQEFPPNGLVGHWMMQCMFVKHPLTGSYLMDHQTHFCSTFGSWCHSISIWILAACIGQIWDNIIL